MPWKKAKGFDGSAPIGKFIDKKILPPMNNIHFHLTINNKTIQKGNTRDMIFSFDKIIAMISQWMSLKKDDLIFTGTPMGVGVVQGGDRLEGFLENQKLLSFDVK